MIKSFFSVVESLLVQTAAQRPVHVRVCVGAKSSVKLSALKSMNAHPLMAIENNTPIHCLPNLTQFPLGGTGRLN